MNGPSDRLAVVALLFAPVFCGCAKQAEEPPSVLLIVCDTLRADSLGCYGNAAARTPNIDALAREGVVFERMYAQSPWTLPSFGSILTGTPPAIHGAGKIAKNEFAGVSERLPCLPGVLKERGYTTAALVTNPYLRPQLGLGRGFALYRHLVEEGVKVRADRMVDEALEWLAQTSGPVFLLLHLIDPHMKYDPPEAFRPAALRGIDDYDERIGSLHQRLWGGPEHLETGEDQLARELYLGEVASMDAAIGRLIARLDGGTSAREWLVVLTSDHGEEFWEHGGFEHGHSLHEELLRVPLIIRGRQVAARAGTTVGEALARHIDIAPTILELIGQPVPASMEGRPLMSGFDVGVSVAEEMLYGERQAALVTDPYKLILRLESGDVQLFDLRKDPGELVDLSGEKPEVVEALRSQLELAIGRGNGERPAVGMDALARDALRELKTLGYTR